MHGFFATIVILVIAMTGLTGFAEAATLKVPLSYPTIQAGVDAAAVGDTVLLDPGLYFGDGNRDIDFGGKDLSVLSRDDDPATCVVVCQGNDNEPHRGFIFQSGETSQSRVQGLTEDGQYYPPSGGGGAILCENGASPVIANCRLTQCVSAVSGGGLSAFNASPTLLNCRIDHNVSGSNGGGVFALGNGTITLSGCQVDGNVTHAEGGGAYLLCEGSLVFECVLANNTHTGLQLGMSGSVLNTTITGNEIGLAGMHCTVENTLVTFNYLAFDNYMADAIEIGNSTFICCNVFGNNEVSWHPTFEYQTGIDGNISENPLFCDADNWDYHLAPDSPCLDGPCGRLGAMGVGTCPALSPTPDFSASSFGLMGNYPNPFNPRTELVFSLERESSVWLEVYDVAGRKVRTIIDSEIYAQGEHRATWQGRNDSGQRVAAGVYFSVLTTPQGTDSRRMVLLK